MKKEIEKILEGLKDDIDYNDKKYLTNQDIKLLKEVESYAKKVEKWASNTRSYGEISDALRYTFGDCKRHLEEDLRYINDAVMDMK